MNLRSTAAVGPGDKGGSTAGAELRQALAAWKGHCLEGAAALARHDLEGVEGALAARDALRPRVEALIDRIRETGTSPELLAALARLQQDAAAADSHLISLVATERTRLRSALDGLGRDSAPTQAYRAPDERRSRLDIVR